MDLSEFEMELRQRTLEQRWVLDVILFVYHDVVSLSVFDPKFSNAYSRLPTD